MAQYRLLAKTFINGAPQDAGAIVEYDGQPGSTMQPVETNSKTEIPENWRDENGLKRIALAKSLGAPPLRLSAQQADTWIQNELDNRELAKAQKPEAKPSFTDKLLGKPSDPDAEAKAEAKAKREAEEAAAKKAADDAAAKAKADADKSTT